MTAWRKILGGLKSEMILADIFPQNTNAAGVQIGNSQRVSNSPTPSLLLNQFTNLWVPKCWVFFCARFLRFPRLKAFPFDQQSLQVVVASEKLMADEMVRSPKSRTDFGVLDVKNGNLGGSVHGENSGMSCNVPICLGILQLSNWYGFLKLRLFQYEIVSIYCWWQNSDLSIDIINVPQFTPRQTNIAMNLLKKIMFYLLPSWFNKGGYTPSQSTFHYRRVFFFHRKPEGMKPPGVCRVVFEFVVRIDFQVSIEDWKGEKFTPRISCFEEELMSHLWCL